LLAAVDAALDAGLTGVLLRERRLDERAFLALAHELRARLDALPAPRSRGSGWLGVHDRAHLAALAGADGVHLGFRSLAPAELPAFARGLAVGLSAHAGDEPAAWAGADYLVFGPVRDTPSKRGILEPVGIDGLAAGVRAAGRPVWALGGIEPADVAPCLDAGARGVAVLRGILGARDPGGAAAAYLAALGERVG
jgi:thiamine-phosphate diphosphorylase